MRTGAIPETEAAKAVADEYGRPRNLLLALAYAGFFLNLFNLIPVLTGCTCPPDRLGTVPENANLTNKLFGM